MRDIQVSGQLSTMQRLIKFIMKGQVNDIMMRNRRFPSSEYNTTVNVMKAVVIVVTLVRESTIVVKDVLQPLATLWLWGYPGMVDEFLLATCKMQRLPRKEIQGNGQKRIKHG